MKLFPCVPFSVYGSLCVCVCTICIVKAVSSVATDDNYCHTIRSWEEYHNPFQKLLT